MAAFVSAPFLLFKRGMTATTPRRKPQIIRMSNRHVFSGNVEDFPDVVRIALTREVGKNSTLQKAVEHTFPQAEIVVLPCVETVPGRDRDALPTYLTSREGTGWVVITSPEAASVFINGWRNAGCPPLGQIAAVGKATGDILRAVGVIVSFEPSKATAKTLVKEFPAPSYEGETVLYPASAKASGEVVDGLSTRGYKVVRLNTYSTECTTLPEDLRLLGAGSHIVTFASPSAVKGWVSNIGVGKDMIVACIGETSARAAREMGFRNVHYPERPGIEGWISAICDAMKVYDAATA